MKNLFLKFFYLLWVRPLLKLIVGVRFENTAYIRKRKQFIMVANHNSHLDAVALMAALPATRLAKTKIVVAQDYWGTTRWSRAFMNLFFNPVQIKRKKEIGDPSMLDELDKQLKAGYSLIVFPEGTRGEPGVLADFKCGVAVLLERNPGLPFIPAYLNGFGRVLPKDQYLIIPLICKVRFGRPQIPGCDNISNILESVKAEIVKLKRHDEIDRNQFRFE